MHPELAAQLIPDSDLEMDLEAIWKALCTELLDRNFSGRTHNNRRTYDAGCRGPACTKSTREHARRRTGSTPTRYYKSHDAIVAYWYPVAIARVDELYRNLVDSL